MAFDSNGDFCLSLEQKELVTKYIVNLVKDYFKGGSMDINNRYRWSVYPNEVTISLTAPYIGECTVWKDGQLAASFSFIDMARYVEKNSYTRRMEYWIVSQLNHYLKNHIEPIALPTFLERKLSFKFDSAQPLLNTIIQPLLAELGFQGKRQIQKYVTALTQLLVELIFCATATPQQRLVINLSNTYFNDPTVKALIPFGSKVFSEVTKALAQTDYVKLYPGFHSQKKSGRTTRLEPTKKLADLILQHEIDPFRLTPNPKRPIIKLRDSNKKLIGINQDTNTTRKMVPIILKLNNILANSDITYLSHGIRKAYSPADNYYYRSFNNSSYRNGGRFYGHSVLNLPQAERTDIQINGEETVELDYGNQHPRFMYHNAGCPLPSHIDVYDIKLTESDFSPSRNGFKSLLVAAIGIDTSGDYEAGVIKLHRALCNDFKYTPVKKQNYFGVGKLTKQHVQTMLQAILLAHPALKKTIFHGMASKFQFLDSKIAEYVIRKCLDNRIIVLPVHDSFIVQKRHAAQLRNFMIEAYTYFKLDQVMPNITAKGLPQSYHIAVEPIYEEYMLIFNNPAHAYYYSNT